MTTQEQWKVTGEDRSKHDGQFFKLKPVNGFITGDQARGFFMQSGLPTTTLGQIWGLADINNDGKMDKKEFSIAMYLIKKKLQGYELPKILPTSLKADPNPVMGGVVPSPVHTSQRMVYPGPLGGYATLPLNVSSYATSFNTPYAVNGYDSASLMNANSSGIVSNANQEAVPSMNGFKRPVTPSAMPTNVWSMPQPSKLKFTQVFNSHDRQKTGFITGVEARALMMQSGLSQMNLAQIWNLADIDKDGKLTCDEFCIAWFLMDQVRAGHQLPSTLPNDLIPLKLRTSLPHVDQSSLGHQTLPAQMHNMGYQTMPSHPQNIGYHTMPPQMQNIPQAAKAPQADAFGDLLGGFGAPPPAPTPASMPQFDQLTHDAPALLETFEDKRKQNFDKGQAELEKRRQALQDQLRHEEEARLEKERKEQEKLEQQRIDRDRKKQQEIEKQLEKQREIEKQREEQRQKMLEQRESARRELERQRQMEWENQRKEQLLSEKIREMENLDQIKSQNTKLSNELETLESKKSEIIQKTDQIRSAASEITSSIERMRQSRDLKVADIERFHNALQEANQNYAQLQREREELAVAMQTSLSSNPICDMHRTLTTSVQAKKSSIEMLKKQVSNIEKSTADQLSKIDSNNSTLKELNEKLAELEIKSKNQLNVIKLMNNRPSSTPVIGNTSFDKKEIKTSWFETDDITKTSGSSVSTNTWGFDFSTNDASAANDQSSNWATAFASSVATDAFSSTPATSTKVSGLMKRYRAVYQFDARNTDEISLYPGDIVYCNPGDTSSEPGWMNGTFNGRTGCFPEAFVEEVFEDSLQLDMPHFASDTSSHKPFDWSQTVPTTSANVVPNGLPILSEISSIPVQTPPSPVEFQGSVVSEQLVVEAVYPWKAKKDRHLTFNKGDVINVIMQQDMWWFGQLNGREGWFPKSYVVVTSGPISNAEFEVSPNQFEAPAPQIASVTASDYPQYVAIYTYTSEEPSDLTFNQGEIIEVHTQDGDWWTGAIGERTGMFPANYVKKWETQPIQKSSKKPEIATVIAAYTATGREQLSLQPGQLIQVKRKNPSGWWQGELQARGQKKKIGWFPADYVKLLGSSNARSMPDITRGSSPAFALQLEDTRTMTPSPATVPPELSGEVTNPKTEFIDQVVAIYPYTAQNNEEMTFDKDTVINVISKDGNWWVGELNGSIGIFPSNYIRPLTHQPDTSAP